VFEADEMTEDDFIDFLGDDYEADLEGESIEFGAAEVIQYVRKSDPDDVPSM
jgi:hypothetical protein